MRQRASGQRELPVERPEVQALGVRDSGPSAGREKRCVTSVTMTQILSASPDVMAICSPAHVDLSSLRFPEAVRRIRF